MEATSPPKRMTRARAAAKDKDSKDAATAAATNAAETVETAAAPTTKAATKSTRAAPSKSATASTAASKAKAVTTTRATKRKTRADEDEDDLAEAEHTMNKPAKTRGRPKKIVETEPEPQHQPQPEVDTEVHDAPAPATRATRGRAKKATTTTTTSTATTSTAPAAAPKEEPAKATRTSTRARKTATNTGDNDAEASEKPARKTRTRATSKAKEEPGVITTTVSTEPTPGLKSAISRPASRIGGVVKKTVTFQEREKENLVPAAAPKGKGKAKAAESATGMRAKPVRKPAATGRATRASKRTATTSEKRDKSPLSPKKEAENRSLSRDADSDDELATLEKTPLKPLMRSPVKPPNNTKKPELLPPTKDDDGDVFVEKSEPTGLVLGSPARRPPSSTPFKDTMKSPAKKVDAIPSLIMSTKNEQQASQSPAKASILQSPAKRPQMPIQALQPPSQEPTTGPRSSTKMSLMQSPAKRPTSPFKLQGPPAQPFGDVSAKLFSPKKSPVEEKAAPEEEQQAAPSEHIQAMESEVDVELEVEANEEPEEEVQPESPSQFTFNGRLSAVLPRHADPALRDNPLPVEKEDTMQSEPVQAEQTTGMEKETTIEAEETELANDPMDIDVVDAPSPAPTTPPQSPPKPALNPAFGLRAKDLNDDMSDSEDELASSGKTLLKYQDTTTLNLSGVPATPTPAAFKTFRGGMPSSAAKAASRAIRSVSKGSRFGFTPLANQLSEWKASSPSKAGNAAEPTSPEFKDDGFSMLKEGDTAPAEFTPTKGMFEEEMRIRAEMENQAAMEALLEADIAAKFDEPEFDDVSITKEDTDLAAEANEMSLMDDSEIQEMKGQDMNDGRDRVFDDSVSEGSQEYGDENAVPIDPTILSTAAGGRRFGPMTPLRPFVPSSFHTVSKVPLKPADDSSPKLEIMKMRSASASKLPANRPTGLFRNATVISYSPTKGSGNMDVDGDEPQHPPVTPSKTDIWSSMGTPARTPRRDLNAGLLRGAVCFVDVHTSDGADASTVFVELLTQMGARCVKSWPWNPAGPANGNADASASKIGITHVVYKDGGKRTLEKVRETGGVVQCVGVGWVLDCERENEWLDEAPYYIDTALVPRGGRNRRKSMEPKALANLNGTLVTPMHNSVGPARECQTVPNNHISRRDTTLWMRTPSDHDEDEDAPGEHDWDREIGMLTPVPKTPAPETVARFAMDVTPDTPSTVDYNDLVAESREHLLMRTCPPKQGQNAYADLGDGLLRRDKDQGIMMRLMAARRKSLQFAPKVASPLSKAWN
ncbi:hypothetical protein GGR52DRAFT_484986 [Hypoxylon sp. FL1284]|nr:hypothetical protein GGR52DRAFT_484986 [Hypoxylon sp. FL1284]